MWKRSHGQHIVVVEDIRELESPGGKVRQKVRESGEQSGGTVRQSSAVRRHWSLRQYSAPYVAAGVIFASAHLDEWLGEMLQTCKLHYSLQVNGWSRGNYFFQPYCPHLWPYTLLSPPLATCLHKGYIDHGTMAKSSSDSIKIRRDQPPSGGMSGKRSAGNWPGLFFPDFPPQTLSREGGGKQITGGKR